MRVLVVDDDIDTAELTAESLRLKGLDVAVANGAVEALHVIKAFMPQTALLDIELPEMDGHELDCRMIATGFAGRLIAITGYGREEDRARSAEAGFVGHRPACRRPREAGDEAALREAIAIVGRGTRYGVLTKWWEALLAASSNSGE